MRALKVLVVVMGVMIVVGFAALIVIIVGRVTTQTPTPPLAAAVATAANPVAVGPPFTAPAVALPAGARVEAMSTGPDRVVLDLLLGDGQRELVIIDLATGRKLGTIPLRSTP